MNYLLSIAAAQPSLHLNSLRARGLDLAALFEVPAQPLLWDSSCWTDPAEATAHTPNTGDECDALPGSQFAELCLNDE